MLRTSHRLNIIRINEVIMSAFDLFFWVWGKRGLGLRSVLDGTKGVEDGWGLSERRRERIRRGGE